MFYNLASVGPLAEGNPVEPIALEFPAVLLVCERSESGGILCAAPKIIKPGAVTTALLGA
jgi:hypothetical protein